MKRSPLSYIFLLLAFITFIVSFAYSQDTMDVVYLKSGDKIVCNVLKRDFGEPILVQLQSKETITIAWDNIKEIDIFKINHKIPEPVALIQDDTPSKTAVYIEGLGVGILYSINFDRIIIDDISIRIGFSSWTISILGSESFTGVPIMCNYLSGSGNSKLEVGLGFEYVKLHSSSFLGFGGDYSGSSVIGISSISYRYQPKGGGLHFRIGLTPLFSSKGAKLFFGISIGICS